MKKSLQNAMDFAHQCNRLKIAPDTMAAIIHHVNMSAKAWENASNSGNETDWQRNRQAKCNRQYEAHTKKAESIAASCGYSLMWPGLYPVLVDAAKVQHHIQYTF